MQMHRSAEALVVAILNENYVNALKFNLL